MTGDVTTRATRALRVDTLVYRMRDERAMPHDTHESHEMIYVLAGTCVKAWRGGELVAGPGEAIVLPAGTPHISRMPQDGDTHALLLQWAPGDEALVPCRLRDPSGRLLVILQWMRDLLPATSAGDVRQCEALLDVFLAECQRQRTPAPPAHDPIAHAIRGIVEGLDAHGGITVREMALDAGMPLRRFQEAFKARTGETPVQFMLRRRAEAALALLRTTDLPLKEIATRVGLCNAGYLWRLMLRFYGRPPGAFRGSQ